MLGIAFWSKRPAISVFVCGRDHGIGRSSRIELTDILGKGAGHQFDVLWEIADMPAKRVPIPLGLDIFEDMLNYHLM
jgi:hypothetical protein